jgi:hypothetical protein
MTTPCSGHPMKGCQMFPCTTYQKRERIYQMSTKWLEIIQHFFPRPYKIFPNWNICFANIPSGNTATLSKEKQKFVK